MSTLSLSTGTQVHITAIICSLTCLLIELLLGVLFYHLSVVRHCKLQGSSSTPPIASTPVVYEDVSHIEKHDIELNENVAYGPI